MCKSIGTQITILTLMTIRLQSITNCDNVFSFPEALLEKLKDKKLEMAAREAIIPTETTHWNHAKNNGASKVCPPLATLSFSTTQ